MKELKFKIFSQYKNLAHGISTRNFGSMKNEDSSINRKNLNKFLKYLKLSENSVCMEQIHGPKLSNVSSLKNLKLKAVDGLITNKKNIPLCVVTADCLPILFYDPEKNVIGVAHGGRKGLMSGIIKNMTDEFKSNYKSDLRNIKICIGPGIEEKCYKVDGKFMNLRRIAHKMLLDEGILQKNIEDINICTKCKSDTLYSYRGGDKYERFATVISMI